MSHHVSAFTIDYGRSTSHYRNAVMLLIACAVGNILSQRVYALDSPGLPLTRENIDKQRHKFVVEIRTGDLKTIRSNRPIEVRISIESKASGFKKSDVNAMLYLGRVGAIKEGESQLGYFSLKPNIIDERVVFYMFVVPEALERMGIILDCGRNEKDLAEAGAYQLCPSDFLSKEQVAAIKKLKDAR